MTQLEIGAFPFIMIKGKLMVMLITNMSGNSWILPKGQPEPHLQDPQVALLEAYEEAGVIGTLINTIQHKEFKHKCGTCLRVYPLAIHKILTKWPEKKYRKRQLVSVKEALKLITRKEHTDAIVYFSRSENIKKLLKQKYPK